jgi:hypothetical protein
MTGTPPSEQEEKDEEKDQDENNTNAGQENPQQSEDLRIWNQIQDFTDIPEDPGLTAHPELYNTTTATHDKIDDDKPSNVIPQKKRKRKKGNEDETIDAKRTLYKKKAKRKMIQKMKDSKQHLLGAVNREM